MFALGAGIALIGDAAHIASGTTAYTWSGIPVVFCSAVWFPVLVGGAIVGIAYTGARLGLPRAPRSRRHVALAACLVLALYALTALLRDLPPEVTTSLCGALAAALWLGWDASRGAFGLALGAALLGPLFEIGFVRLGAVRYADDSSQLFGVAPWLPCLYFAAGAVSSGLLRAVSTSARADPD